MSNPLVSVVTPTKNRRALLGETMDSVQRQSLDAWEHIIVDDGSDDGTAEEVRGRAMADPRLRYLLRTGQRAGANVCRNQGLAAANADLIVFLDSDDVLEPHCLARRVEIMRRNLDLDFAVSRMGCLFEDARRHWSASRARICSATICSLFYSSSCHGRRPGRRGGGRRCNASAASTRACPVGRTSICMSERSRLGFDISACAKSTITCVGRRIPAKVSTLQRRVADASASGGKHVGEVRTSRAGRAGHDMDSAARAMQSLFLSRRMLDGCRAPLRCAAVLGVDRAAAGWGRVLSMPSVPASSTLQSFGAVRAAAGRRVGHKWKGSGAAADQCGIGRP